MRELDQLCRSYGDLLRHLDPAAASAAGFVSADGQLGRFDDQAVRQHVAALKATAGALEDLDVETLADEIDRTALLDEVRATTARLEEDRPHRRNPAFWIDHLSEALGSLLLRSAPEDAPGTRAHAAAERIAAVPGYLDSARATLSKPPVLLVDSALSELGALGEILVLSAERFGAEAPGGAGPFNVVVQAALEALARLGHWLRSELEPDAGSSVALGEERFDRRLHQRYAVQAGASELGRYATRLVEETEAELTSAARALEPGAHWRDLLARLEDDTLTATELSAELARVREKVGGGGALGLGPDPIVEVAPPALRHTLAEVTYIAGPEARLLVSNERLSRAAAPVIAAAALAGRHLQETYLATAEGEIRRQLRTPIAVDGWALYAEQWMEEAGAYGHGAARLMRLSRLLGAAGLLAADVGIHARGMSPSEAMAQLADRSAFTRAAAEAAVRRIVAHPTELAAAALGRRELLRLRAAAGVRVGDRDALNGFHAAVLGFGALPPGLAGWGMGLRS